MSEFKFRAWDRELQKMLEVESLEFSQWWVQCKKPENSKKSNGRLFYGERNSFKNEETDRHILMQYSGLKDSINKDIYCGDIVSIWDACLKKKYITQVVLEDGAFKVKSNEINAVLYFKLSKFYTVYIIGNIYENPELLEGK